MTDAMTDAAVAAPKATAARSSVALLAHRPARHGEIKLIVSQLHAVIDESPFYNDRFKAFEKRRLSAGYLEALMEADPWHVLTVTHRQEVAGAIISGPEFGSLFRYWSWVAPRFRDTRVSMYGMRAFEETFDNGRFHKVFTYVRPENETSLALLRRYGYRQVCLLEKHLFGLDFVLMEKPYTKQVEGYDSGIRLGRLAAARRWLKRLAAP